MNERHIAGYRVVRRLGGGGMGEVFEVEHPRLPRNDALKLLHNSVSTNAQYKARFDREAFLLAKLNHRNIVHLYDRGEFEGRLWITMEYVAGPDTAQMLAERGPMPLHLAIEIADGAAAGLDYAYRHAKITHRDIKPANILVAFESDGAPQVKLADFGIAKAAGESVGVTSTGITVGTMAYMSPEAFDNQNLDNRADLYSLACTVYELLTGAPPFPGDSPAAVIGAHLNQPPPKITAAAPHLPAHLNAVFRKALAKEPGDRYASGAEFVAGLRGQQPATGATPSHTAQHVTGAHSPPARTNQPAHIPQPNPTRAEALAPLTRAERLEVATGSEHRARRGRRSWPLAVAALILVIAIGIGAFFLVRPSGGQSGPSDSAALEAVAIKPLYFEGDQEASSNIDNVLTGNTPSWRTDQYFSGPRFGNLKSGTGLLITLSRDAVLTSGTITSPSAGSTVQVRTASSAAPTSLDETSVVWDGTLTSGDTDFTTTGAQSSKYVLIWITGLTQINGKWQTTIAHVQLRGD